MGYIDDALAAGIPMESIQAFLRSNPGDEHRLISALAGPREQLQGQGLTNEQIYRITGAGTPIPGVTPMVQPTATMRVDSLPREIIGGQSNWMFNPSGLGDVVGDVLRGEGPLGDIFENLIGRLPLPGGGQPPRLPPATPPVINIPPIPAGGGSTAGAIANRIARFLARISPTRLAQIAAAAAAVGMTVQQYLTAYPGAMTGGGRRMNPLNPRALRRSIRRLNGFEKFVRKTYRVPAGSQFKTKKFKSRKRA